MMESRSIFSNKHKTAITILFSDKSALQSFILYQKTQFQKRLRMTNSYKCSLTFLQPDGNTVLSSNDVWTLAFYNLPERHLKIIGTFGTCHTLLLRHLRGCDKVEQTIRLNQVHGDTEISLVLTFMDARVQEAAFDELRTFSSERINVPTPPSLDEDSPLSDR